MASTSPLSELAALLDGFIPMTNQVNAARREVLQKEAATLEKVLARVWMIMPYLHEGDEPGECPIINRSEEVPLGPDRGFRVSNQLTLLEDGPRLIRSFAIEHFGPEPDFVFVEIKDKQDISCETAIKTYGFEEICGGLIEMLRCQCSLEVEARELQSRIEQADELLATIDEKLKLECQASDEAEARPCTL